MTRLSPQDREIALLVAAAWLALSEAVDAAEGISEQAPLQAEEALLAKALDRIEERLNVESGDLAVMAQEVAKTGMFRQAAERWAREEREAEEKAERARLVRLGYLVGLA